MKIKQFIAQNNEIGIQCYLYFSNIFYYYYNALFCSL